ncbi:MAG: capsule assembly Wzi family protein [Janthinobacterium lividum]
MATAAVAGAQQHAASSASEFFDTPAAQIAVGRHLVLSAAAFPLLVHSGPEAPADGSSASAMPDPAAPAAYQGQKPFLQRYSYDGNEYVTPDPLGSTYIPMDSWMYPALLRLYSLGYLDTAFLSLRPWTRRSVLHILDQSESDIRFDGNEQALELLDKLYYALRDEPRIEGPTNRGVVYGMESAYAGARVVGGTVLRDSWNLGTTFNNDYGRPYSNGFNTYNGVSGIAEAGPFSLYVRGEYQHAPAYQGYSYALAAQLSGIDRIQYPAQFGPQTPNQFGTVDRPQATIPEGPLPSQNNFRILEANLSAHVIGHEISLGKSDAWLGPGLGGAMAWSNNAENIYSFRINRIEPLHIPYFSRLFGNVRYDFFLGSLKGHTHPRDPWIHSEIIALAPTKNFQFSFQRSIIFGGAGHAPVTLHTFLNGFFHTTGTSAEEKYSRDDPGARFSSVTFSYRLPFLRKYATLYADSITHDDVFPVSAPRRAGWRPGIFLPRLAFAPKLDLRAEATYTDYVTTRSTGGQGVYLETVQQQGYTNKGFIIGDWIGREGKGGQAWLTYHLSGNETIALQYLRKKNAKDFLYSGYDNAGHEINGGTTQDIIRVDLVKRLGRDVELKAWYQNEHWVAPIWKSGRQGSNTGAFQVTWYPKLSSTSHF